MTKHRNVLVVGVASALYERVAPVLRRREFDVDRFPSAAGAIELLGQVRFAGLIIGYPLPGGDAAALIEAVRASGANAGTAIAVLHAVDQTAGAEALLEWGADHLLPFDATAGEYERFLASALGIPPRSGVRLPVRLRVSLSDGADLHTGTTENVSCGGMLVDCHAPLLIGDRLRFKLEIDEGVPPVEGTAEVVRIAEPAFDGIEGYGLHFRDLAPGSEQRLEMLLDAASA